MIRSNFSKDAPLIDSEILDYDTLNYNETGINDGRMRLPTMYDISKYYKRNVRNAGKHIAVEYGRWVKKENEDLPSISDDFDWQIAYSFPPVLRNPRTSTGSKYGGRNVTFRRLYLILCERFNGGEFFIDTYFDSVYPYTVKQTVDERLDVVKKELTEVADSMLDTVDEMLINKDGTLNKKATKINKRASKVLRDYASFAKEWEDLEGEEVARIIREDIISCVTTGQLPCQFAMSLSESTRRARVRAGLSETPKFSATEQLINSIQLFVKFRGNGEWETRSGLMV